MDVAKIVSDVRTALPRVLVAVDFDGTLAPLVADPEQSRPVDGTIEVLRELAGRGVQVAVVTGRDARTVLRLSGLDAVPRLVVAGLYGLETWSDGALHTPDTPEELDVLRRRLPDVLRTHDADPDVWIEDKRLSLVVHARRAQDPDAALAVLRDPVAAVAGELGLELHPGRDVLELRLPGFDKAGALRRLVDDGDYAAVLYIGDDLGDLPAFAEAVKLRAEGRAAYGVGVLSSGVAEVARAADVTVADADAVVGLLRKIAD